jgi:Putative transmembrane protein (PGPGW)
MDKPDRTQVVRIARVTAGLALLPVGVALLVLPGPGIPVVAGSLMLLESEFEWAGRARVKLGSYARAGADWVQKRRDSR